MNSHKRDFRISDERRNHNTLQRRIGLCVQPQATEITFTVVLLVSTTIALREIALFEVSAGLDLFFQLQTALQQSFK